MTKTTPTYTSNHVAWYPNKETRKKLQEIETVEAILRAMTRIGDKRRKP